MTGDLLSAFDGLEVCADCGTLQQILTLRCPECGRFHSSTMVRKEATVEEARSEARGRDRLPIDPSHYSLNPTSPLFDEEEDEQSSTVSRPWQGGVTDFAFEEE